MVIREMSSEVCLRVLAESRLARLACAYENQPYVVPVYLAYDRRAGDLGCFYGFTTPGQKVEWMRANPLVCVEVDEVAAHDQWVSVIVFGHYQELPDFPGRDSNQLRMPAQSAESGNRQNGEGDSDDERMRAYDLLKTRGTWWEPSSTVWAARAHRDPAEPYRSVYYKVRIDQVTGHEATPDARDGNSYSATAPRARRKGWMRRTLTRVFGDRYK